MAYPKDKFEQDVAEVRGRMQAVRDAAKDRGIPNTTFYHDLQPYITPYGVRVSMSWLREQCDPENLTPPSLRKLFALKQALEEYQRDTGITGENSDRKTTASQTTGREPRTASPEDMAVLDEHLENLGKIAIEDPTRAIFIAAKLLNEALAKHVKEGGGIMVFLDYLRARISFAQDITLSNMPLHTLRDVRTKADAQTINPAFKTIAAILHAMAALHVAYDTFPWGDDAALNETIRDIVAQQAKANEKKKTKSLAQQNKALMQKVAGITVIKPRR